MSHYLRTDKEMFEATYWQWLRHQSHHLITAPLQMSIEIKEACQTFGMLGFWLMIVLTFPISFPIIAAIAKRRQRDKILMQWSPEELERMGIKQ